ncbi:hypothetical protein QQX98_010807 [Neonectria punicea]|uniref:PD-(D/E)XK nuclease-like domain-containing protein n=1 Tax=Neonectria punicea TaxID=979145 RepID=A0ABR1GNH9_9HYPO
MPRDSNNGDVFDAPGPRTVTSTHSSSSFTAVLATRALYSAPTTAQQPPTETSSPSTTRSRSSSPTKRYQKTASLLNLVRPVRFTKESDLGNALPDDIQRLYETLSTIEGKEDILPAALREHADFKNTRIRPFMWEATEESRQISPEDKAAALDNHARLRGIVDDSISSSNLHRSEAAWNCLVHIPLLRHATSAFAFVEVEPITSAQIMPAFRPLSSLNAGDRTPSQRSNTSGSSASFRGLETPLTRASAIASSVHKMVDFALVLRPDEALQSLIQGFLSKQPHTCASINQTIYEPLRLRPAPIFIETKTSSGNMDTANVQLGVWVAAWHERLRSIIAIRGETDKVITIPVIQVVGSVWTLLFAVDGGSEIVSFLPLSTRHHLTSEQRLADGDFRVGDTSTIVGIYQLRATMAALACWMEDTFEPWITDLLISVASIA